MIRIILSKYIASPVFKGPAPTHLFEEAARFIEEETRNEGTCVLHDDFTVEGEHNIGAGAEALAVFLRSNGLEARVFIATGRKVIHRACGRTYVNGEWTSLPVMKQSDEVDGRPSHLEIRTCDKCKSTISLGSMRVE